jgi:hypothetical protein
MNYLKEKVKWFLYIKRYIYLRWDVIIIIVS